MYLSTIRCSWLILRHAAKLFLIFIGFYCLFFCPREIKGFSVTWPSEACPVFEQEHSSILSHCNSCSVHWDQHCHALSTAERVLLSNLWVHNLLYKWWLIKTWLRGRSWGGRMGISNVTAFELSWNPWWQMSDSRGLLSHRLGRVV